MIHLRLQLSFGLLLIVILGGACNRTSAPPTPIPIGELPAALDKAFSKAKPELKAVPAQIVTSLQAQDYAKAYFLMQELSTKPGLNKEQLEITARGSLTINSLLQEAQAKGDTKAAEVIKFHRENK
jgi:hypothetical protein